MHATHSVPLDGLEAFIVLVRAATCMWGGASLLPYRLASKDLQFAD